MSWSRGTPSPEAPVRALPRPRPGAAIPLLDEEITMNIDKNQIIQLLREQGHPQADQAEQELPDQVDTDQHANLLSKFGINPQDLLGKLGGGGGLGNLLG
jgi:hypothetical protein